MSELEVVTEVPPHPFKDEWAFQRRMPRPYPGNSAAGQPIAPDQPCFVCDVPFKDHPLEGTALRAETPAASLDEALADVAKRHRRGDWTEEGWQDSDRGIECFGDGERWPCSAERLRAAAHPLDRTAEEEGNG